MDSAVLVTITTVGTIVLLFVLFELEQHREKKKAH